MAANPVAELTDHVWPDVLSEDARATIDRAREQFLLHLATPVLRHEQSLRDGAFPFASATPPRRDPSSIAKYPLLANAIATAGGLYVLIGILALIVIVMGGYMLYQQSQQPSLEIKVDRNGIQVNGNG